MILQGVDRYRFVEPLFEGVRVILSYRGEPYSPAYIQGLSGAAFRVAGICPCAPTCSSAMSSEGLVHLLGYEWERLAVSGEGATLQDLWPEHLARIRVQIDAGRPVLVWNAFTLCEYDVVVGYENGALYGRGSHMGLEEYAVAPEDRPTTAEPALDSFIIGNKTGVLDARAAEVAALHEAVRHAHDQANADKLCSGGAADSPWIFLEGLMAYDRWVSDWAKPDKTLGVGDCYCLGIYRSTHRAGAAFLHEIAPRHPNAAHELLAAAEHMVSEADMLDQCWPLLWWKAPKGPDVERNARATALLAQARAAYARAIDAIEAALPLLD